MSKILITGSSGYLGRSISEYLLKNGFEVYVLVRESANYINSLKIPENRIIESNNSKEEVFDVIIHCATLYKSENAWDLASSNIAFPIQIANDFLAKNGCFVNIDTSLKPETNLYSTTKFYFEKIIESLSKVQNIKILNLQLEYFFDENEPSSRFLPSLIRSCLNEVDFDLTEGNQIRDFIHMSDLCSAIETLLKKLDSISDNFKTIEIGSGVGITIKELASTIKTLTKSKSKLNFGAIPYRNNETMFTQANTEFLKSLGWDSKFSLKEGLIKTIQSV